MADKTIPQEVFVITGLTAEAESGAPVRRGFGLPKLPGVQQVNITQLQEQVTVFLQQVNVIMDNVPEPAGGFKLAEFEVSAGISIQGKGEVKIAFLGSGELSGGVTAGLKFVFRRS